MTARAHVLSCIEESRADDEPFRHLFIENIFPSKMYEAIRAQMCAVKHSSELQERRQDSHAFTNKRYNLFDRTDSTTNAIRDIFSDPLIKGAVLAKFYVSANAELEGSLSIHDEFEYFFTEAGRLQNIHVDIPPKYLSFVFYIPETDAATAEAEARNATILYDRDLRAHYRARYIPNSVCIFAPHFSTYHGFSSTIDRDVLVMFYVNRDELAQWQDLQRSAPETPPYVSILDAIETKLTLHPLLEFARRENALALERAACRIDAPQGRVRDATPASPA